MPSGVEDTILARGYLVGIWRKQEDERVEENTRNLKNLHEIRKGPEICLAADVLKMVCDLGEAGLNERIIQLEDLINGCSVNDQPVDEIRKNPLVSTNHYFDVAEEWKDTKAGVFIKNLFESYRRIEGPGTKIYIVGASANSQNIKDGFGGFMMLCNGDETCNRNIYVGFSVAREENKELPQIKIRGKFMYHDILEPNSSIDSQFEQMLLSEQAMVIAALFIAKDRAVTEALEERLYQD